MGVTSLVPSASEATSRRRLCTPSACAIWAIFGIPTRNSSRTVATFIERARARAAVPPVIGVLVVPGGPRAQRCLKGIRRVLEQRRRREGRPPALERRIQRGHVDEGLEGGAGLAAGFDRPVEGARAVVPPTHHRADRAVLRLEGKERGLRGIAARAARGRARIRLARAFPNGLLGRVLE